MNIPTQDVGPLYECRLCGHNCFGAVVNRVARNDYPQTSVSCARCAFVQVAQMPTESEVAEYYESGLYRKEFPALRTEAEEDMIARSAAAHLATLGIVPGCGALEIGCGYGRVAALTGASAIEADPACAEVAAGRGVSIVDRATPGAYSFVYAMQVLEHQVDPVSTLRLWRSYLKPDTGRIHLQVPTLERMYGGASHFFQRPHVVNFTTRTLRIALYMAGFGEVTSSIGGNVLEATAYVSSVSERSYGEAVFCAGAGPIDDVPALIAAHERGMVDRKPSDIETWLADEKAPRPTDAALRHALGLFAALAATGMDGVARLAQGAEARCNAGDDAWSLNPWVLGYQAGCVATHQRYQQATAHLANALKVKVMG